MKKVIEDLAVKYGVSTSYQGSARIMFLKGERALDFKTHVKEKYPSLAFDLKISEGEIGAKLPIEEKVYPTSLEAKLEEYSEGEGDSNSPAPIAEKSKEKEENHLTASKKVTVSEDTRKAIDEYILSTEVKKGEYKETATKFDVTTEYVRGRYRKVHGQK